MEKASYLGSFWLFKLPEMASFKSMQSFASFFYCFVPQNDLNDVISGNLNCQKDHKDEVFLRNNI